MKKKYLKLILLLIIAVIVLFSIIIARRVTIKVNLNEKGATHFESENYYMKVTTYSKDGIMIGEKYYRDGESLTNIINYKYDEKTESNSYKKQDEIVTIIKESNQETRTVNYEIGMQPLTHFSENLSSEIMMSIIKGLETGNCNNKECYIFENRKDGTTIYVDKETGLVLRAINDNNGYVVSEYEYEFDNVKDGDIKVPSLEESQI